MVWNFASDDALLCAAAEVPVANEPPHPVRTRHVRALQPGPRVPGGGLTGPWHDRCMQWTRAMHHLETLADTCAEMTTRPESIFPLRVSSLWAVGAVLEGPRELEAVEVVLGVDVAAADVAWGCEPPAAQHWAHATRLSRLPLRPWWRSTRVPVWNHHVIRPLLLWSTSHGVHADALSALTTGTADPLRELPPSPQELRSRLVDEAAVSHQALTVALASYEARRWAPGKLEPASDSLAAAARGHLDVLSALAGPR